MSGYLLISSEDPLERGDARRFNALAAELRHLGHDVTLFLVQNAVLAARATCDKSQLPELLDASVEILADEFSLRERGIGITDLRAGVRAVPIDAVVEQLASGRKALWK